MTLSTSEQESLRQHLGYGNVANTGVPYTPDGWWEIFSAIVSPNLGTGTETSSVTAVTAGSTAAIVLGSLGTIAAYDQVVIDVGPDAEIVQVKAVAAGPVTMTASFAKAHAATGYPVATMSGKARLRLLLWQADQAWTELNNGSSLSTAGLKSVDKGDVEWFSATSASAGVFSAYKSIVESISQLVRVPIAWPWASAGSSELSAY